jgi:hypothetical protein
VKIRLTNRGTVIDKTVPDNVGEHLIRAGIAVELPTKRKPERSIKLVAENAMKVENDTETIHGPGD